MPDLRPISAAPAREIHATLVRLAYARASDLESFVMAHVEGCREYRFQGVLGFGGKFWNDGGPWRVDCYPEDETRERLEAIAGTNQALRLLWDAREMESR